LGKEYEIDLSSRFIGTFHNESKGMALHEKEMVAVREGGYLPIEILEVL
jgi:hypothetical protein